MASNFPRFLFPFSTLNALAIRSTIGSNMAARAVVDGTIKAMVKFAAISNINIDFHVLPKRVMIASAIRLANPLFSMPDVMMKAEIISQITP